ncbi:MAG: L,D-transpeptidase [Phormidesmis sp.]
MRRQPPIIRCFVALCFGSAVMLAAFEWRSPFPDPVVTPNTALMLDAEDFVVLTEEQVAEAQVPKSGIGRFWPFSRTSQASAQPSADDLEIELVLSLSDRALEVRTPNREPVIYPVAVGQDDWQTPTGKFAVIDKLENPAWQHPITKEEIPPGPDNPLGTRWIGFWSDGQAQIGFHGTDQEDLIGEAVSHGCVRMRNQDIQALYEQVAVGTPVKVEL